ncbi:CinA family protein [bacterium]|nr:CinA family protein [bacterium]
MGDILVNRAQTLVTAESCTGGLLASLLTDTHGASRWFERGWITYSNQAKITELDVEAAIIEKHGAVSEEVVTQMAAGALADTGADWAVGISGIAGPDGGTDEKPVGTVWIAVASTDKVSAKRMQFGAAGQRDLIKMRAAHFALFMLFRRLIEGN